MKTYVLIHGIANIVAGGPIYDANKERYLEERGWTVNVLPTDSGTVFIEPLKKYSNKCFPFIQQMPFIFSKKELEEKIDILSENIQPADQIIIETGTDYTALWGELLAKRLNAKHVIIFLDEKNSRVNKNTSNFYKFKYQRGELASISIESLKYIFLPYFKLDDPEKHVLKCCCTNSVGNINADYLLNKIPCADYTIGSIGRLEKPFVPYIVEGILQFARSYPNKTISICFFGDSDFEIRKDIENKFARQNNVRLLITGYIWPIPKDVFKRFDVFVSGAGASRVSANQGITTVHMDAINCKPLGFVIDTINFKYISYGEDLNVIDYLKYTLVDHNAPEIIRRQSLDKEWKWICGCFDAHMDFINNSASNYEYFPTEKISDGSPKIYIKRILLKFMRYDALTNLKRKLRNLHKMNRK